MATLKYRTSSGEYKTLTNYSVQPITPVQVTGTSATDIMSQNAVTNELNKKATKATTLSGYGITDAKISDGTITLGDKTIKPITAETGTVASVTITGGTGISITSTDPITTSGTRGISLSTDYQNKISSATTLVSFLEGANTVTSISSIPITKRLCIASVTSGSFTLANTPSAGREIHVIIKNTSSSDITITIPNGTEGNITYNSNDVTTLTIKGNCFGEINAISDGSTVYIRTI